MKKILIIDKLILLLQIVVFIVDIVLSLFTDVSIYVFVMFGHAAVVILYYAIVRSIANFTQVYNKKEYLKAISTRRGFGDELKVYKKAKRIGDKTTARYMSNSWISVVIVVFNLIYVIVITSVLHPESIS